MSLYLCFQRWNFKIVYQDQSIKTRKQCPRPKEDPTEHDGEDACSIIGILEKQHGNPTHSKNCPCICVLKASILK